MKGFFAGAYGFSVAIVFAIAHFGPFPWFNYAAVGWFAGFLAVVVGIVYVVVRKQQASGGGTARASSFESKGAKNDR